MKHVLITGGSRGIGAAAVELFSGRGDRVTFLYEKEHEAARQVAQRTGATAICCDVADGAAVNAAFSQIGHVDILICNAGICYSGLMSMLSEEQWDRIFAVNVKGIYNACAVHYMYMCANTFVTGGKGENVFTLNTKFGNIKFVIIFFKRVTRIL